jgi:AcrR family transcriptional regulator
VAVEKLTPERRRELTRTALIDSARHAFAQKGFEGASLDEIAADAGFTRGAIYKHFDNKEDLFLAVMANFNERMLDSFAALIDVDIEAATDPVSIAKMLMQSELSDPEMWHRIRPLRIPQSGQPATIGRRPSAQPRPGVAVLGGEQCGERVHPQVPG